MDPFAQLPAELIQHSLIYTPDFVAIEGLLSVSARVNAVFKAQPSIIHSIILGNTVTRFPEIQRLIYNLTLINAFYYPDLPQYRLTCEGTPKLDYKASVEILHVAARVQNLACACLSFMQDTLASTFSAIPAGGLSGPERAGKARKPSPGSKNTAPIGPSSTSTITPPSAKRQQDAGTGRQSRGDLDGSRCPIRLGLSPTYGRRPEQLNSLEGSRKHPEGSEFSRAAWNLSQLTPIPFIDSFDLPRSGIPTPIWSPPPVPPETEATASACWQLTPEYRLGYPMHVEYFQNTALLVPRQLRKPSLGMTQFKSWCRLGLVIWDSWRMYTVRLCHFGPRCDGPNLPNPDGTVQDPDEQEPDLVPRWLALVGERVSDC
ncbi:uncharacterized protein APUU_21538S [Aspergillus puulaauensis]|uniref:Uncharacterized protein n=1 Tax=Aspergillus puulaauensis TaxID=1220207 RepID=A0A7R7XGQ0_9EURO|nr:uncharacterized protein APUU_21538S [Aspergillus puulaauensis]BCS21106.1 hypothetical protein APUU_21538S [Aspergillus puulaauensis]